MPSVGQERYDIFKSEALEQHWSTAVMDHTSVIHSSSKDKHEGIKSEEKRVCVSVHMCAL